MNQIDSSNIAPGTRLIVFRGGAWDGRVTAVAKTGPGRAERRNPEGGHHVYVETDETEDVEVVHVLRSGTKIDVKPAVVYDLLG